MKIAMIVPALINKGPVIVAKELINYYLKQGHQCTVYYFDKKINLDFPCETKRIGFFKKINIEDFDIIHTHTFRPDLYLFFHYFFTKRRKTKFVSTLHQPLTYKAISLNKNKLIAIIYFLLSKLSHRVMDMNVLLSSEQLRLSSPYLKGKNKCIISNGRDIQFSEISSLEDKLKISTLKSKYKIIGTVSVINRRKGLEQVLKALVDLPDYAFVCIGDGPNLKDLKEMAFKLNIDNRCCWLGSRNDGANYQKYFDIFIMTSRSEGFPLSFIEAAAYGIPTVLSDIPILKSMINEKYVCFYKLDDIESLKEKILICYEKRDELSKNIKQYYTDNLTAKKMGETYLKMYKTLLES